MKNYFIFDSEVVPGSLKLRDIKGFACVGLIDSVTKQIVDHALWIKTTSEDDPWDARVVGVNFKRRSCVTATINGIISGKLKLVEMEYDDNEDVAKEQSHIHLIDDIKFDEYGIEIPKDSFSPHVKGLIFKNDEIDRILKVKIADEYDAYKMLVSTYYDAKDYTLTCITDNSTILRSEFADTIVRDIYNDEAVVAVNDERAYAHSTSDPLLDIYVPWNCLDKPNIPVHKSDLLLCNSNVKTFVILKHNVDGYYYIEAIMKDSDERKYIFDKNYSTNRPKPFDTLESAYNAIRTVRSIPTSFFFKVHPLLNIPYNEFMKHLPDEFKAAAYVSSDDESIVKNDSVKPKKITLNKPTKENENARIITHDDIDEMFLLESDDGVTYYFTLKDDYMGKTKYRICTPKDLTFDEFENDLKLFFNDKLDLKQKEMLSYKFVNASREPVFIKLDLSKYRNKE